MTLDLILTAQAAAPAQQSPPIVMIGYILIFFVMMYFLMIRPQQKRAKEHQALVEGLKSGDKILTAGGIYGVVTNVRDKDKVITVRIAENVKVELEKSSVTTVIREIEAAKS